MALLRGRRENLAAAPLHHRLGLIQSGRGDTRRGQGLDETPDNVD